MVVDSSALIAICRNEPEATRFSHLIVNSPRSLIAAPNLLEVSLVIEGLSRDAIKAGGALDVIIADLALEVAPFDAQTLVLAQDAFRRYGKGRHPAKLNFGDCISYATAKYYRRPLLYKGAKFALTDVSAAAL